MQITKIIILICFALALGFKTECFKILAKNKSSKPIFTLMLDPAGDAKHAGRKIDDCFERGITLQAAEQLKKNLENKFNNLRVILTRFPGESLEEKQNASFANRLDVDFYLSIHFYYETQKANRLTLYYFLLDPTIDFWQQPETGLSFIQYNKAHKKKLSTTKKYGEKMAEILKTKDSSSLFQFTGLFGLPHKPLLGIASPAISIEIGLKNKKDWEQYLMLILESLTPIITNN